MLQFATLIRNPLLGGVSSENLPSICKLPPEQGKWSCSEKISRYYYNQKSKHCEQFIYSGCGGNANNFSSSQESGRGTIMVFRSPR
uniref:BPTI/Kunitz inhibitor domain-containing protein n=1 Tax=Anolis carolinensis TaxID=28377 RepID=A0A803TQK6_ANOCA